MRGSKAKKIRRAVYGDQSLKQKREYVRGNPRSGIMNGTGKLIGRKIRWTTHTLVNASDSLRAKYQAAKKAA